jgi:hypothetical protein
MDLKESSSDIAFRSNVRAVMARDRVSREGLIDVIRDAQRRLRAEKIPA